MTITEFLLARIAEDEAQANNVLVFRMIPGTGMPGNQAIPDRVLAECEAKRAILTDHRPIIELWWDEQCEVEVCEMCDEERWECSTVRALAAVYSTHPDCRKEWAL